MKSLQECVVTTMDGSEIEQSSIKGARRNNENNCYL